MALLPWQVEVAWPLGRLNVPEEPLLALLSVAILAAVLKEGRWKQLVWWLWPAWLWLAWLAVSACWSPRPVVSWKYWTVSAVHFWVFGIGMRLFPAFWPRLAPWLCGSAAVSVVYSLAHHATLSFRANQALLAPMPFYPDHTLYAAFLAMLLPWAFSLQKKYRWSAAVLALGWLAAGSRGALAAALAAWTAAGIRTVAPSGFWKTAGVAAVMGSGLLVLAAGLLNRADVSAAERLNRFACGRDMAAERPMTGFGPGTFAFDYLVFQKPENRTRISVDAPVTERNPHTYGRGGGAHSEYVQALAETGWPGLVCWLLLVAWPFAAGRLPVAASTSLLTFCLLGVVNNYLHDARIACLFWVAVGHACRLEQQNKAVTDGGGAPRIG